MKKLMLLGAIALFASPVTAALAVPMCDGPRFDEIGANGLPLYSEEDLALQAEMQLRQHGIHASMTRFWNGCIQTFVREDGHSTMRFYDPNTFAEVPVN
ncbi:MAG: hypothetical protein ABI398_00120 [Devosia sp.]